MHDAPGLCSKMSMSPSLLRSRSAAVSRSAGTDAAAASSRCSSTKGTFAMGRRASRLFVESFVRTRRYNVSQDNNAYRRHQFLKGTATSAFKTCFGTVKHTVKHTVMHHSAARDKTHQDDALPVVALALLVDTEVHRVEVQHWRPRVLHQELRSHSKHPLEVWINHAQLCTATTTSKVSRHPSRCAADKTMLHQSLVQCAM